MQAPLEASQKSGYHHFPETKSASPYKVNITSRLGELLTGQAVILAAGKSSRFWPLNKRHKSLSHLLGRPLILFTLDNLKKAGASQVVIVQGPKKDIERELKKYKLPSGLKLKYIVQKTSRGTGDALLAAKKYLQDKFLVLYGDDFYGFEALKNALQKFPCLLVKEVVNPSLFGIVESDKGFVKKIVEKSPRPPGNLANAGGYHLPKTILAEKVEKSARGELEITDYVNLLAKKSKVRFVKAKEWFPLSFAWDLLVINEFLLGGIKREIKGTVEKNCQIKGQVFVGKGTLVKSGSYIEGPVWIGKNCLIGPNCYIRPSSSIADNCRIGQAVEVKNSIIGSGSKIAHLSYVPDSVIGENCIIGGGTIIADLRFDGKNVLSMVKGELLDTGRRKFGVVLGQGVKVGVHASLMPGVLAEAGSTIYPHSLVKRNVEATHLKNRQSR